MTHDSTAAAQETQRRLDIFTPAFQRLVTVVAQQVQYPPDHQQWHQDEVQDFKQARYAIAEALEDAAGKASVLQYSSQVTGTCSYKPYHPIIGMLLYVCASPEGCRNEHQNLKDSWLYAGDLCPAISLLISCTQLLALPFRLCLHIAAIQRATFEAKVGSKFSPKGC